MNAVRNSMRDGHGADFIEYGLLVAFVAAMALVTIATDPLGIMSALQTALQSTSNLLSSAGR